MGEESKEPVIESAVSPVSAHEPKSSDSNDFPDRPYMSVQEAIKAKDYEAILPFIKANGFNPNQQTMPQNKSVLHELAESTLTTDQVVAISKELLVLGANPNLTDNKQETPLHIAVKSCQYDLASLLIKYGANSMTAFNIDGNLPWHFVDKLGSQEKCERMKEILRVGLEAFIEQEDQTNQHQDQQKQDNNTFNNWGNLIAPKDNGPNIETIGRKPDNMWSNDQPKTNTWPDPLEFGPMPPTQQPIMGDSGDGQFEPIRMAQMANSSQLGISVPIGAEIQKKNGSSSPFDLSVSEDSDSNTRWEPAALWDESKPLNDAIWEEKRLLEEKPSKTLDREKGTTGGLFGKAIRESVRDDTEMRKPMRFGGNSAMDAVLAKTEVMSECDERNDVSRLKLKKLCDQYRGKFPRIDGMRDLKDKSIAVLHFSAEQGYNMSITDALDAGVEVNSRRNGKSALLRTIVDGKRVHLDSARLLLRNGADADFQDANGNTFLHLAVSAAHVSAVDAVLRHNPSLELKNNAGLTAWGLAQTKKGGGNVEIVRTMLIQAWKRYKNKRSEEKVDEIEMKMMETQISQPSSSQSTLSSGASDKGGLLQRKSLISAANCGAQDQIKALLADPTIDVNEQSAKGFSALHCAAGQGKIGIVRMLLNYNANPDLQTRDGYTALMLTASSTRAWPEVADALLKAGANPNVRDMNGNTALHHASRNVHVRLVQLLCNRGADVSVRNKQGVQARGVKPWDGKRGWSLTPERWSQETKDAVRDIKNILQEAFGKQKMKKDGQDQAIQSVKDMMDQSSNSSSPMLVLNEVNSRLRKVQAENSGKQSPRPTEFNRTIVNNMFEGDKSTIMDQDQNSTLSSNRSIQKVFEEREKSDFSQQLIAVSTQVSTVSTQISHVNTTVMRLADQQSILSQSDYHRNAQINELLSLAQQNDKRLTALDEKLDFIMAKLGIYKN